MCGICNNHSCINGSKCVVKSFTSELTYDGLASPCNDLALIKPNCMSLNQLLELYATKICEALNNDGLDGPGYNAESVTSQILDGLFTSRSISITPVDTVGSTGTSYDIGCRVRLASLADPTIDYMEGVVTAFDNTTGAMTFLADHFGPTASGAHIDWNVSLAGDVGTDGTNGTNGTNGAPGVGGMAYEHYNNGSTETNWTNIQTVDPIFSHTVTADGDYQIHVMADLYCINDVSGQMDLFINGVSVLTTPIRGDQPTLESKHTGFLWRGNILNTQTIEVKVLNQNYLTSSIATNNGSILINKEV